MLKKVVSFILTSILWPILREVLTDLLKQLLKAAIGGVKTMMKKWEKEEIAQAQDASEVAEIEKKYRDRQGDLDGLAEKLSAASDKIVDNALTQGEKLRADLIAMNAPALKQLEAPKEEPGAAA